MKIQIFFFFAFVMFDQTQATFVVSFLSTALVFAVAIAGDTEN